MPLVPVSFVIPAPPASPELLLEPLGPQHNASDLAAWGSSTGHIRATPGFAGGHWPPVEPFTQEQNLVDLVRHAADFAARTGFTWTVLDPVSRAVIGCVYVYPDDAHPDDAHPDEAGAADVHVRSWVRADRGELDGPLFRLVSGWLAEQWPFERIRYAPR